MRPQIPFLEDPYTAARIAHGRNGAAMSRPAIIVENDVADGGDRNDIRYESAEIFRTPAISYRLKPAPETLVTATYVDATDPMPPAFQPLTQLQEERAAVPLQKKKVPSRHELPSPAASRRNPASSLGTTSAGTIASSTSRPRASALTCTDKVGLCLPIGSMASIFLAARHCAPKMEQDFRQSSI
ncbi:MAG: hypothetical protein RLO15_16790 [Parvibaculum sp.]